MAFPVIGPFSYGVGVVDDQSEPRSVAGRRPLQHLEVAIRVATDEDGAFADFLIDGDRLAGVRWLLIRREDQYRVYDLTVETPDENGTFSLLQTQREEFNSVLSSNGGRIGLLLDYLRDRIRESGMTPAN